MISLVVPFNHKNLFYFLLIFGFASTMFFQVYAEDLTSPKKQFENGISHENIVCKENLVLIFKNSNISPACVKESSVDRLIARGWASSEICPYCEIDYTKNTTEQWNFSPALPAIKDFSIPKEQYLEYCTEECGCGYLSTPDRIITIDEEWKIAEGLVRISQCSAFQPHS